MGGSRTLRCRASSALVVQHVAIARFCCTFVFVAPKKRERERERERACAQERERERKRERKKREREREREGESGRKSMAVLTFPICVTCGSVQTLV